MSDNRCPQCHLSWSLFPPVRVDEPVDFDGVKMFKPGSFVRCVECKVLVYGPEPEPEPVTRPVLICPICAGRKKAWQWRTYGDQQYHGEYYEKCDACDGTGVVSACTRSGRGA